MRQHAWRLNRGLRPGAASLIRMGTFFTPHRIYIIGKEVPRRTLPANCVFSVPSFPVPLHTSNLREK